MSFVWSIVTVANTGHKLPYEIVCLFKIFAILSIILLPFHLIECFFKILETEKKEDKEKETINVANAE